MQVNYLAFMVFLSMKIMSGLPSVTKWSVCTVNSQSILQESFLMTASG